MKRKAIINVKGTVSSAEAFEELLKSNKVETQIKTYDSGLFKEEVCIIKKCSFKGLTLKGFSMSDYLFEDCDFVNCSFMRMEICGCHFLKSQIHDSSTELSQWTFCEFNGVEFNEFAFGLACFLYLNKYENVIFERSYLESCTFVADTKSSTSFVAKFEACSISEVRFVGVNFSKVSFHECNIFGSVFSKCILLEGLFVQVNYTPQGAFNQMDLHTINDSETLSAIVLKEHFGINEPAIKEYIAPMLSEIKFQKVFISYSLQDKDFARRLSDALFHRGVVNYLFEKHAIAGEGLQHIMHEKQREYDRLLFIASDNSLKSRPCHVELTEAREREKKDWKDIFCPITIDDYIFKVEKHHIKDEENADEFWKNIQSLRKVVVQDFSAFRTNSKPTKDWDLAIDKLVKALKLDG